jgi:hypothetical protein
MCQGLAEQSMNARLVRGQRERPEQDRNTVLDSTLLTGRHRVGVKHIGGIRHGWGYLDFGATG